MTLRELIDEILMAVSSNGDNFDERIYGDEGVVNNTPYADCLDEEIIAFGFSESNIA